MVNKKKNNKGIFSIFSSLPDWQKIFFAIFLGVLTGFFAKGFANSIEPVGRIFINLIKMVIVPLIFGSISSAIVSMKDTTSMGRMAIRGLILYTLTTILAGIIGMTAAKLTGLDQAEIPAKVTENKTFESQSKQIVETEFSFTDVIVDLFPSNPIKSMAAGDVLQVIIFAVFVGITVNALGAKASGVASGLNTLAEIMYKMTDIVMKLAPYGVYALISSIVANQDPKILLAMLKLMGVGYVTYIFQAVFVYGGLILVFTKLNPIYFLKKMLPVQVFAYSVSSSSATLPLNIDNARKRLGVSKSTADFCLPLGTTINMDGTSITVGLYAVFLSGLFGIDLGMAEYIKIAFMSAIVSIGTAGIPGASLVLLSTLLVALGFDSEQIMIGLGIIFSIDRLMDMARTAVNVTGDAAVSIVVDNAEGGLNDDIYKDKIVVS